LATTKNVFRGYTKISHCATTTTTTTTTNFLIMLELMIIYHSDNFFFCIGSFNWRFNRHLSQVKSFILNTFYFYVLCWWCEKMLNCEHSSSFEFECLLKITLKYIVSIKLLGLCKTCFELQTPSMKSTDCCNSHDIIVLNSIKKIL
jgi:hypothetical protein